MIQYIMVPRLAQLSFPLAIELGIIFFDETL